MNYYYSMPFRPDVLVEKKRHPLIELRQSIQLNINLLIKTHFGDYRYDKEYGCYIWNKDYTTVTNVPKWKDELRELMQNSIEKYETRLKNIKVTLDMEEVILSERFKGQPLKLKKKISVHITGIIKHLSEPFEHYEFLLFSPLSIG